MALYKIKDFDPNYRDHFDGNDARDLDLYSGDQRVGSVDDVLVDEEGHFRYLIINTGAWIFGKKVLLPMGRTRIDYNDKRVYADALTKDQVEALPAFTDDLKIDRSHEDQVRGVYRSPSVDASMNPLTPMDSSYMAPLPGNSTVERSLDVPDYSRADYNEQPLDSAAPVAADATARTPGPDYRYEQDPDLYQMNDEFHRPFRLYEERLIANKRREKTGEVAVGKRVETERKQVSVPVEKERVVIERVASTDKTPVTPGDADFQGGEVARMEVYEETPDIHKEAFVREEVRVKKVVDQDTVEAEEQLRREQLDVKTDGRPVVEQPQQ